MPPKAKAKGKSKAKAKKKPEASEHVIAMFRKFDVDNSGTMSRSELQSVLQRLGLDVEDADGLMGVMDKNGDDAIDLEEFADWVIAGSREAEAALALDEISLSVTNVSGDVVLEIVLPDYTCIVELKKRIQATTGTDVGLIRLLLDDAIAEDQTSLAALGLPAEGAVLQYVALDKPTFEFPMELEVDDEIVPRRALLQHDTRPVRVEIAFYGAGATPKLLMQYATSPDWHVRQVCGQVTGWGHECAEHYIEGLCCEGPPGTPLDNARVDELFDAGRGLSLGLAVQTRGSVRGCGLLDAIGVKVDKNFKKEIGSIGLQIIDGDKEIIEIMNDHKTNGRD